MAAANGHAEIVSLLLDNGAVADAKDTEGRTPLWQASANGHEAVAKVLQQLDRGGSTTGVETSLKDEQEGPVGWHRSLVRRITRPLRAMGRSGQQGIREAPQVFAAAQSEPPAGSNAALQAYHQQLAVLEQQNKTRLKGGPPPGKGSSHGSTSKG
jgi:hypothetical protein